MQWTRRRGTRFFATALCGVVVGLATAARGQIVVQVGGGVRGLVLDAEFGGGVAEAAIRILELGREERAAPDGHFLFEGIPAGTYTLLFSKGGYTTYVVPSVLVRPGELADVNAALKPEFTDMEEFVVKELELGGTATEAGLLQLRETSLTMQDSISSDLIGKAGASDAAGALRLVVGASVADGKYATVRGLSDRYVGAAMNGLRVPSSDPRKRAVHMDVFPAGTIESISVSKTFTPNLPGDYSGGGVNIRTIAVPEEPFFKFSFSREHVQGATGKDGFRTYAGAGAGTWGRHNGARDMTPGMTEMEDNELTERSLPSSHDQVAGPENPHSETYTAYNDIVEAQAPAMGTTTTRTPRNSSLGLSAGGSVPLGDDWSTGGIVAFTYKRDYDQTQYQEGRLYLPPKSNPEDELYDTYGRGTGTEEVKWSMLAAVGLRQGDRHAIDLTLMRNRVATDQASLTIEDHEPGADYWEQEQAIHYVERTLDVLQLRGHHEAEHFGGDSIGLEFDWFGVFNRTEQEEPDVRYFKNYVVKRDDGEWQYQPRTDGSSGADSDSSTRVWRNTREDNSQFGADVKVPFQVTVADLHHQFLNLGADKSEWAPKDGSLSFGVSTDVTRRWYTQNAFYYTFGAQSDPVYGGPQRNEFPPGPKGQEQYEIMRGEWLLSPDGEAYQAGIDAAADDREVSTYTSDSPDELWTDTFTDTENLGTGAYQDSMLWYLLPKFRDVSYTGDQMLKGGYVMLDFPVTKQLSFMYGGRAENTSISIAPRSDYEDVDPERAFVVPVRNVITNENGGTSYYYTLEGTSAEGARADLAESDWLRAAGVSYALAPGMYLKGNWGQTIARPTFLELAPVVTYDYISGDAFVGNNDLKISHLNNYDLRWEWFRRAGQVFSASWFFKRIEDPIEYESFGYLGQDYLLAVNYPKGKVKGYELEVRQPLDFLPWLFKYFSCGANYTKIEATVELPEAQQNSLEFHNLGQDERPMEGQPAYLGNINLTFDHERWGTSVGAFWNFTGDTLKSGAAVGDTSATPDVYITERMTVNLSLSQKLSKHWKLTLKAKNVTDPHISEIYRAPDGTETLKRAFQAGVAYSVGLNASW